MKQYQKFVAFDLNAMNETDKLVNNLLSTSIKFMNDNALRNPNAYKNLSGSDVEKLSYNSMIDVAPSVSFPKERIKLVSGHVFPDIILNDFFYGVEIKSTQKDAWTSTGSSIVESSRSDKANRIYMLFGKLGGQPEFRCKPYQLCLSNIAVTHSPRYLIDMELDSRETIFSKMKTDYDDFRILQETDKISKVRKYFLEKAKADHKDEMPWWMGETTRVNLSFYNDLPISKKKELKIRAFILFKDLYGTDPNKRYRSISLWLCTCYSLLCQNMRDFFSAGGTCKKINGIALDSPYPHIVIELLNYNPSIKALLDHPDKEIILGINDYWDFEYNPEKLYYSWVNMIEKSFHNNPDLKNIPIKKLLINNAVPR